MELNIHFMSVFLCCLDVSYCMRCLVYWDRFDKEEEGGVWERTLWRYWRCWSEEEEASKHFHKYCHCIDDSDNDSIASEEDNTTEMEDFESTFDRDMLIHFTEMDDQMDIVTASHYLDLLLQWMTVTNMEIMKAQNEVGDYYENHKAWPETNRAER